MSSEIYGFIGLGLIGGSIARAIKKVSPDSKIIAYTPHRETVDNAFSQGIIDSPLYEIGSEFSDCDYIFLCAPVEVNNDNLSLLLPYISKKTTITDIGSVKNSIHSKGTLLYSMNHPICQTAPRNHQAISAVVYWRQAAGQRHALPLGSRYVHVQAPVLHRVHVQAPVLHRVHAPTPVSHYVHIPALPVWLEQGAYGNLAHP